MSIDPATSNNPRPPTSAGSPKFAELPLFIILVVFIPIALTNLVSIPLRPYMHSLYAHWPMFPFLVYAFCNWIVVGTGYALLKRRGITWSDLGFKNFRWGDLPYAVGGALVGLFVVYPVTQQLSA